MGGHTYGIVGRATEVGQLLGALASARAGTPAVALVTGEAGIGKTTLWRAALGGAGGDLAGPAPIVVTATCDEAVRDLTLGVVDQLLRRAAALGAAAPAADPGPGADPVRVGGALLAVVDGLGLDRPLVVVVDDAQWADDASLAALAFAARRAYGRPVSAALAARLAGHTGGHPLHTATLLDELPYEAAAADTGRP